MNRSDYMALMQRFADLEKRVKELEAAKPESKPEARTLTLPKTNGTPARA